MRSIRVPGSCPAGRLRLCDRALVSGSRSPTERARGAGSGSAPGARPLSAARHRSRGARAHGGRRVSPFAAARRESLVLRPRIASATVRRRSVRADAPRPARHRPRRRRAPRRAAATSSSPRFDLEEELPAIRPVARAAAAAAIGRQARPPRPSRRDRRAPRRVAARRRRRAPRVRGPPAVPAGIPTSPRIIVDARPARSSRRATWSRFAKASVYRSTR